VLVPFVYVVACRLFALVLLLARSDRSKELELLVLRHEVSIPRRQARRPQLTESDRVGFVNSVVQICRGNRLPRLPRPE
jgi:putative transposase